MRNKNYDTLEEAIEETPAKPKYVIDIANLNVRENPGRQYNVIGTAIQGPTEIVETYKDEVTGLTWGRIAGSGWVDMQFVSEE